MSTGARITGPESLWAASRFGDRDGPTPGVRGKHVQTSLVVLPETDAFDFLRFCGRNPKPCPLIEATDPGNPEPKLTAPGADLCMDLPRHRVYRDVKLLDEPTDVRGLWREDFVSFLNGRRASGSRR